MAKLTPEEILENIENSKILETHEETKGKLKIFLGYCAGVGKTYHMLDIARDMLKKNHDIVIGYIEMHDRKETLSLLEGMEILPNKIIKYENLEVKELDVEAVINRKPQIVIIDEYAHTNIAGVKNEKRYQDIQEILNNGIDVYTTLNVQHIESLNETIKKITNIKVKETVPDVYVKMADNIELIDIEPKELIHRIQEGKVYKKEKIKQATHNFFAEEKLTKLREITLKYMVDSVDRKSITTSMKEKILLVIQEGEKNEEIIQKSYNLAEYLHCRLEVEYLHSKKEKNEETIQKPENKNLKKIIQELKEKEYNKLIINKKIIKKHPIQFYKLMSNGDVSLVDIIVHLGT